MSGFLDKLSAALSGRLEKSQKRTFLEACMAASAIVAMADREVRLSEQVALSQVLNRVEQLRKFDPNVAVDMHRAFVNELADDYDAAKTRLLTLLATPGREFRQAELIVKIGLAIAKADNDYSNEELAVLEEICQVLGVPVDIVAKPAD